MAAALALETRMQYTVVYCPEWRPEFPHAPAFLQVDALDHPRARLTRGFLCFSTTRSLSHAGEVCRPGGG